MSTYFCDRNNSNNKRSLNSIIQPPWNYFFNVNHGRHRIVWNLMLSHINSFNVLMLIHFFKTGSHAGQWTRTYIFRMFIVSINARVNKPLKMLFDFHSRCSRKLHWLSLRQWFCSMFVRNGMRWFDKPLRMYTIQRLKSTFERSRRRPNIGPKYNCLNSIWYLWYQISIDIVHLSTIDE